MDLDKGMSPEELDQLCSDANLDRGVAPWIYWTSEAYGFGRALREYSGYPSWLPLAVYSDHSGPRLLTKLAPHELRSRAPWFLTHTPAIAAEYSQKTGRSSAVIPSPAVLHRRRYLIERRRDARGTVAFPTHRTPGYFVEHSLDEYCARLKQLPEEFQPVRVCLHMHDVRAGIGRIYIEKGISVVTAGHAHDQRFLDRFYAILASAAAATSDAVGSATLYALEMGIPFFLEGDKAKIHDLMDPKGDPESTSLLEYSDECRKLSKLLLRGKCASSYADCRQIALSMLGMDAGIDSRTLNHLLWKSLILWLGSPKNIFDSLAYLATSGRRKPMRT